MNTQANKTLFTKLMLPLALTIAIFSLSACQNSAQEPERPTYPPIENKRNTQNNSSQNDENYVEIVPTLNLSQSGQNSEFKLRSQTSKYLNAQKTELEVVLSDNRDLTCENSQSKLAADQQKIVLTLKADQAFDILDLASQPAITSQAVYHLGENNSELTVENLQITNLNDAIVRGELKLSNSDLSLEGEFFTAVCK